MGALEKETFKIRGVMQIWSCKLLCKCSIEQYMGLFGTVSLKTSEAKAGGKKKLASPDF